MPPSQMGAVSTAQQAATHAAHVRPQNEKNVAPQERMSVVQRIANEIRIYYQEDPTKAKPDNDLNNLAQKVEEECFNRTTTREAYLQECQLKLSAIKSKTLQKQQERQNAGQASSVAMGGPQVARGPAMPFQPQPTQAAQGVGRPQLMNMNIGQHIPGQPAGAQANPNRPPQQQGLPPGQPARPPTQANIIDRLISMPDHQIVTLLQARGQPPDQQRDVLQRVQQARAARAAMNKGQPAGSMAMQSQSYGAPATSIPMPPQMAQPLRPQQQQPRPGFNTQIAPQNVAQRPAVRPQAGALVGSVAGPGANLGRPNGVGAMNGVGRPAPNAANGAPGAVGGSARPVAPNLARPGMPDPIQQQQQLVDFKQKVVEMFGRIRTEIQNFNATDQEKGPLISATQTIMSKANTVFQEYKGGDMAPLMETIKGLLQQHNVIKQQWKARLDAQRAAPPAPVPAQGPTVTSAMQPAVRPAGPAPVGPPAPSAAMPPVVSAAPMKQPQVRPPTSMAQMGGPMPRMVNQAEAMKATQPVVSMPPQSIVQPPAPSAAFNAPTPQPALPAATPPTQITPPAPALHPIAAPAPTPIRPTAQQPPTQLPAQPRPPFLPHPLPPPQSKKPGSQEAQENMQQLHRELGDDKEVTRAVLRREFAHFGRSEMGEFGWVGGLGLFKNVYSEFLEVGEEERRVSPEEVEEMRLADILALFGDDHVTPSSPTTEPTITLEPILTLPGTASPSTSSLKRKADDEQGPETPRVEERGTDGSVPRLEGGVGTSKKRKAEDEAEGEGAVPALASKKFKAEEGEKSGADETIIVAGSEGAGMDVGITAGTKKALMADCEYVQTRFGCTVTVLSDATFDVVPVEGIEGLGDDEGVRVTVGKEGVVVQFRVGSVGKYGGGGNVRWGFVKGDRELRERIGDAVGEGDGGVVRRVAERIGEVGGW
ncbi:hypothetical protein HDV00_005419 [Rhizophlyctis rosea]|nr:hypothetical protein HDV00_005419 [Rhizophlyctis rosea]